MKYMDIITPKGFIEAFQFRATYYTNKWRAGSLDAKHINVQFASNDEDWEFTLITRYDGKKGLSVF